MIQLGILLTQQHRLLSVAAILDVFETANRFYEKDGKPAFFQIGLLYPSSCTQHIAYPGHPVYPLDAAPQQNLMLISCIWRGKIFTGRSAPTANAYPGCKSSAGRALK